MKSYPKVFVIILNHNGRDYIKRCLSSVFKNDYPNFEVLVVDNNSTDDSLELANANFSRASFIKNEENLGFSAGNNIGIRFALERKADYVLLLNNDVVVEGDFLGRLVEVAEKKVTAGIVSPVIFNGENRQVWFSGGKIRWLSMKAVNERSIRTQDYYQTGYISGCAMLIKRDVFKKIGLLDEDFFLYLEDVDFSLRAKRAGYENIVVTSSWIYHFERSEKNREKKIYWLVISGLIFFKKNTPMLLRPWMSFYLVIRKLKNRLDLIRTRNPVAESVHKAYKDFKNAKF